MKMYRNKYLLQPKSLVTSPAAWDGNASNKLLPISACGCGKAWGVANMRPRKVFKTLKLMEYYILHRYVMQPENIWLEESDIHVWSVKWL